MTRTFVIEELDNGYLLRIQDTISSAEAFLTTESLFLELLSRLEHRYPDGRGEHYGDVEILRTSEEQQG